MKPGAQIDRKIATFTSNVGKLKTLGHEIALMIFDHANDTANGCGDCTRAIKLVRAFPNSWQPQLVAWFKAFTPIIIVEKNDKCELSAAYKASKGDNRAEFWDRETAAATPFYDLTDEAKVAQPLDFEAILKLVAQLGSRIEKKIEDGSVKPEDVDSAKAVAVAISGLKFERVKAANDEQAPADLGEAPADEEAPALKAVG